MFMFDLLLLVLTCFCPAHFLNAHFCLQRSSNCSVTPVKVFCASITTAQSYVVVCISITLACNGNCLFHLRTYVLPVIYCFSCFWKGNGTELKLRAWFGRKKKSLLSLMRTIAVILFNCLFQFVLAFLDTYIVFSMYLDIKYI